MAPPLEQELQQAIEQWLHARDHFHGGNGIGVLDSYWDADRCLLTAFATGWECDETLLADSYHHFRKRLVEDHERATIGWRQPDSLA